MRITRDTLLSTARDTVRRATLGTHDLVCVYATGSLVREEPLVGGATDIDLVYVHAIEVPTAREIIPVTEDFHLDITHLHDSFFSTPRNLRTDLWIGSFLCHYPIELFDANHWFEYVQAAVFAHFYDPPNIIQRVRPLAESARASWRQLQSGHGAFNIESICLYLKGLRDAANAVSCLVSVPLTNRRFLLDYPARTRELNMPGLSAGLIDLIVPSEPIEPDWDAWLTDWRGDFNQLANSPNAPLDFLPTRLPYYEKAILELKESNQEAALWILLWTWTEISTHLSAMPANAHSFRQFCQTLMLGDGDFNSRVSSLDGYLDAVEETIERWEAFNGI
jgi:hypothetical protein